MNYYIKGNAARAEEIKAAFERLGYNTGNLGFTSDQLYYTVEGKVELVCTKSLQNLIKTHPDYKKLELPIEPNFKVGDDIETGNTIETIAEVDHATRSYCCESGRTIWFENQDLWHLAPKKHYAIANFKPYDKVLIRVGNESKWTCDFFSYYHRGFHCIGCDDWSQCIPFNDDTKHLLGTTDPCGEEYINW